MVFAAQVVAASLFAIGSFLAALTLNLCAFFSPILGVGGIGILVASFFLPDQSFWVMAGVAGLLGCGLLSIVQGALERA